MKYKEKESSKLEFKRELPKGPQIIKTSIAFSNTHGGKIIIGVQEDGEIIGLSENKVHEAMEWIDKSIYESCIPPIIPLVYQQRLDDRLLLIIEIAKGMQKPYYQRSLGLSKGTFIRLGRSTMLANSEAIEELRWQSRGISYDQLPLYTGKREDIDFNQITNFLKNRRNGAPTREIDIALDAYHIVTKEHLNEYPTIAGVLLFGREPQKHLQEAYILCSHFSGIEGRNAIASKAVFGTIFEQFDAAYDFVVSRLNKSFTIETKKRKEKLEVPPQAIREVLMNALLHRNYHINAPIKVAIYNDRIEIFSPGNFPGPITTQDLESGITYVRNTALAKVLWESQYVEKMGSGFIELFRSYREYNLEPPVVQEGLNFIKCILPRKALVTHKENPEEIAIYHLFHITQEISTMDVVEKLHIPKTSAVRLLNTLIEKKMLVRIGKGRNTRYRRSESTS